MKAVQLKEAMQTIRISSALGLILSACTPAAAQERPPIDPRLTALEFFQPTPKISSISSYCSGHELDVEWSFDGERSTVARILIGGQPSDEAAIVLARAFEELGGEVFIQVDCNREGIALRLIEARFASRPAGRRILFNIVERRIEEINRYNFD